jgi:hypothetical protein
MIPLHIPRGGTNMTRSLFSLDVIVVIVVLVVLVVLVVVVVVVVVVVSVVVVPRYEDSRVATSNDSIPSILLAFLLRWTLSSCCRCFGWRCC